MTYYDYHLHHLTIDAKRPESHSQRSSWSSRGRLAGLESVDVEGSSNHPWVDTLGSIFVESWIQESDLCEMQCSEKHWNILKLRVPFGMQKLELDGVTRCTDLCCDANDIKWHQMTIYGSTICRPSRPRLHLLVPEAKERAAAACDLGIKSGQCPVAKSRYQ